MRVCLRRREFIAGLGTAAAWPFAARAQQGDRVRRIGWLLNGDENDPVQKTVVSAFTQTLAGLGWTDGRNMRMDLRWGGICALSLHSARRRKVPDAGRAQGARALQRVWPRRRELQRCRLQLNDSIDRYLLFLSSTEVVATSICGPLHPRADAAVQRIASGYAPPNKRNEGSLRKYH